MVIVVVLLVYSIFEPKHMFTSLMPKTCKSQFSSRRKQHSKGPFPMSGIEENSHQSRVVVGEVVLVVGEITNSNSNFNRGLRNMSIII